MTKNEFKLFFVMFCHEYKGKKLKSVFKYKNVAMKEIIIDINSFNFETTNFDISFVHKTERETLFMYIDYCYVNLNSFFTPMSDTNRLNIPFKDIV